MPTLPVRVATLLALSMLTAACASNEVPVSVACPPPPQVPTVLREPVSTPPSFSERWNALMEEALQSLRKATKPE